MNKAEKNILLEIVKKSVHNVLESSAGETIRVEDFFDLGSITKKDILSITTDITAFLHGKPYAYDLDSNGELVIKEDVSVTMPINQLRQELKKLGFKQWQIKSEKVFNKVRLVVLYVDIAKNTVAIENKMFSCGWVKASMSPQTMMFGIPVRVMEFDPKEQKPITKEVGKYLYLYHLTPYRNLESIFSNGIEARSENEFVSYLPKAHLIKGDVSERTIAKLGWLLYSRNNHLLDGKYAVLRIDMSKIPKNIEFYGDGRYPHGYFTKETIPPGAIELYGVVRYNDKHNYRGEKISPVSDNETMMP